MCPLSSEFVPPVPKPPSPTDSELGRRIAEAADSIGERQHVAALLGVSAKQLRRAIQGDSVPNALVLARLAELSGYSVDYLLTGRGARPIDPELLGRLTDGLWRVYSEEGATLQLIELGRLAAREHERIVRGETDLAGALESHREALRTERLDSRKQQG